MNTDIVVIGGGAAGMLCAYTAACAGADVTLLEPNRQLGRKLRITGKGRCNVTNDCDVRTMLQSIPGDGRFLYSAMSRFNAQDTMRFFESLGVPLKVERGDRVFPVSDRAHDIADALADALLDAGVTVRHTAAKKIVTEEDRVVAVETAEGRVACRATVVCTGGLSYPATGSTGDGLRFAKALGLAVTPTRPSLVPLECADADCAALQGFSLRNVRLTARDEQGSALYSELGEMLFTHFGVSGPLVLSASAHLPDAGKRRYTLEIDLKPGLDEKKLDARVLRDFEKYRNRDFQNALYDLAGRSMIPVLVRRSGIEPTQKVHAITREQRQRLVRLLKQFTLSVTGTRPFAEAIITSGGVSLKEINPRTMASKRVSGLYFAGEVLDLDAYTGGFNLQIAWSTGYTAGQAAAEAALSD